MEIIHHQPNKLLAFDGEKNLIFIIIHIHCNSFFTHCHTTNNANKYKSDLKNLWVFEHQQQ